MTYQSFLVIGTSILTAIIGYLFNALIARPLGPEGISELGVFFSLCVFLCFPQRPLDTFLIRYTAIQSANNKPGNIIAGAAQCLKFSFVINTCLLGLVVILAQPLQKIFQLKSITPIGGAIIFAYLAVIQTILRSLLQGLRWYGKYSFSVLIESLTRLCLVLLLLVIGFSPGRTISIVLIASIASSLFAYGFLYPVIHKPKLSTAADPIAWTGISTMFIYSLCLSSAYSIDVLMVKHYFPAFEAGLFVAASTLAKMTFVIINPIISVAYSYFCDASTRGQRLAPLLVKASSFIGLSLLIVLVPAILFPQEVINLIYGKQFLDAAPLLLPGVFAAAPFFATSLLCNYFLAKHRESFIYGLSLGGLLQILFIALFHQSLTSVFLAYGLGGLLQIILCLISASLDRHKIQPSKASS